MRSLVGSVLLIAALGASAQAHIHLTSPLARTDSLTGDQKEQHCGVLNQARNPARVTTFEPGETITVTWMETINHPGHFRIAFQPDGAVFGIPPVPAGGGFPTANQEGLDPVNNSIVLLDQIPDGTLSATVTLPNIECDNCTLQFIQLMTDKPPYTVDAASDDIYFNCADIALKIGGGPGPMVDGAPMQGGDAGVDPPTGGDLGGGCSASRESSGAFVLGLLALGLVVRRRRR